LSQATYPEGAFTKTGEEQIGGQACVIYTANREAFDLVLPGVISDALLNEETLVPEGIERAEYRVVICPDGDVARVVYEFDAHGKDDTTEKGSFSMLAELSNYGSPPPIVAPTGAVPLPGAADLVSPTEEPTAVTTPQAFSSLEGEWEGTSGDDSPLSFRIEEDAVTFVNINYFVSSGGCSYSGFIGATVDDAPIEDDRFSFVLSSSDEVTLMLSGEFESNNSASGTLGVKGNTGCGEIDTELEWTAQHTSP
jgi:hypothetical protein